MKRFSPWPRSMGGQIALLVAVALFVAQAINFTLILGDRNQFRVAQSTRPMAFRIADALEREASNGRPITDDRGRVRRVASNPIPADFARKDQVATELRRQLSELGVDAARIDTGIRPVALGPPPPPDPHKHRSRWDRIREERERGLDTLMVAVEQPGRGWIVTGVPWVPFAPRILAGLIGQTLILYAVVLLPMLWLVRRLSRPLRDLTRAAEQFRPGELPEPVAVRGPQDIAALITAHNRLATRVSGMLDEKDRMLGAIGHDLRTPLAALRVRIESVDDDDDRTKMADTIDEMTRTLEDILSLARLGRPSEPPVEVDLAALVDAVVDDFRELGHDIVAQDAARLPMRLRSALMRRAVRNLIENAVKYAGTAEVSVGPTLDGARIEVCDRGPGIPEDKIASVFDPFTRLETSRNRDTGGIGLGLALARAIVEEAGGRIALANRSGGGLTATIDLYRI